MNNVPLTILLIGLLAAPARAEDPRTLIQAGNEHFAAGRYEQAREAYQQAEVPEVPAYQLDLRHNQAAAAFKLGRTDEARELWTRIASQGDVGFEARARYNIGNCDYQDALAAAQPPAEGEEPVERGNPLELLDRAIANYRDALRLDPSLDNARANLELAARFKKELEEQSEDQQQDGEDQDGEPGDEGEEGDEQQQDQESQDGEGEDSEQSDGEQSDQQDPSDQEQDGQDGEQNQTSEDPEQDGAQDKSSEQPEEQAEQKPETGEQQPPEPAEAESAEPQQTQPLRLSKEEAERLLQMIRDAEQQRRAALRAREAAKHQPVEKDW